MISVSSPSSFAQAAVTQQGRRPDHRQRAPPSTRGQRAGPSATASYAEQAAHSTLSTSAPNAADRLTPATPAVRTGIAVDLVATPSGNTNTNRRDMGQHARPRKSPLLPVRRVRPIIALVLEKVGPLRISRGASAALP